MNNIEYRNDELFIEDISFRDLSEQFGTPLFVYSKKSFIDNFKSIKTGMKDLNPLICFSIKSCSNINIIKLLCDEGAGVDVVSGGEIYRALKGGCPPEKIVYAGVGKTEDEIQYALETGILMFNAESVPEIELINKIAGRMSKKAKIALRVNPDVDADTHKKITTGKKETKFGIDINKAVDIYINSEKYSNLEFYGVHCHIGSQITKTDPYTNTLEKLNRFIDKLKENNIELRSINIGGGYGIKYEESGIPFNFKELNDIIKEKIEYKKYSIIMEPGRFISGNSGTLLTKVIYVKKTDSKNFIIVDSGMNDIIRPTLYEAHHEIATVRFTGQTIKADIVGPVCETGDFFALDREIGQVKTNDLLAVFSAGAYCASMASNYNSRLKPCEVLVDKDEVKIIRKREEYRDLIQYEENL